MRSDVSFIFVFLGLNNIDFLVPETHVTAMILEVAARNIGEDGLTSWIRDNWPQ